MHIQHKPGDKLMVDWAGTALTLYDKVILNPDNLKVGILSNKKYEDPVVNRSYQELADHYQTALPARVFRSAHCCRQTCSATNIATYIINLHHIHEKILISIITLHYSLSELNHHQSTYKNFDIPHAYDCPTQTYLPLFGKHPTIQ